jgi:hypothetical protein
LRKVVHLLSKLSCFENATTWSGYDPIQMSIVVEILKKYFGLKLIGYCFAIYPVKHEIKSIMNPKLLVLAISAKVFEFSLYESKTRP